MIISGLQKVTLVDYPGKVAATIFTRGCSFRCPFCHNPELVIPEKFLPALDNQGIFKFLESRKGKLEAVCITGGEPMLFSDIGEVIKKIKSIGLLVKLDTNGSFPESLEKVISEGNVGYIAMDIKSPLPKYAEVTQVKSQKSQPKADRPLAEKISKSIKLIMDSGVDYEFRTTVCKPLHSVSDFNGIGKMIKGAKRYFIQNFVQSKHNDEELKMQPFSDEELSQGKKIMEKYVMEVKIR